MAEIAYLLMGHKDPQALAAQARRLADLGDAVAVHFDARSRGDVALVQAAAANPRIALAPRVACGWGEWSLVEATLATLRTARDAFPRASHFYLISGDCVPTKPAHWIREQLDTDPADHIETHDFWSSGWIRTGLSEERVLYRHLFNERSQQRRFYAMLRLQRALGLRRRLPKDLPLRIGSQWWCLRRQTVDAVLDLIEARPDLVRFFRRTWIPDETFFQTFVAHLVPEAEIRNAPPTFHLFTDYGVPVLFHDDHAAFLKGQKAFFARKIAPDATGLSDDLYGHYADPTAPVTPTGEGAAAYRYLAHAGRTGSRIARRAWETGSSIGEGRELLILTAKKWHVAHRLRTAIGQAANLPGLGYVFDDDLADLPDLGGIEATRTKRNRHRRSFLRLVFEHYGTGRLLICLDPSNTHILKDLYGDRATVRLLEIDTRMTDDWLAGHARRIGLAHEESPPDLLARLLPAIRNDLAAEQARLARADFPRHARFREDASPQDNTAALASFLSIPEDRARPIAETEHLFAD